MSMTQLSQFLQQASLGMILLGLVLSELGLPLPETVFVVAAGVVSQQSGLGLVVPVVSSCTAVLAGDLLLYALARRYGPAAAKRRPLSLLLTDRAVARIDGLFQRHGAMAIFTARFVTGLRGAAFALAGMRQLPLLQFLVWDGLAIVVTVPVFAGLGFVFSNRLDRLATGVNVANRWMLGLLVCIVAVYVSAALVRRRREEGGVRRGPNGGSPTGPSG
jgi:membrane protein DedA with SNARE-associated domain